MTKLYLDIETEINKMPNDMDLGRYVRRLSYKKDKPMKNQKDKVAQIMNEWYAAMAKNNISVQPKASTILGTILAKHIPHDKRDIWAEALSIKGGEFAGSFASLSSDEKLEYEKGRLAATEKYDPRESNSKELLKG